MFALSNFIETLSLVFVINRINSSKTTAGLSFYWSIFMLSSGIFTVFGNFSSITTIISGLVKIVASSYIISLQFIHPLSSNKFKEQIYMTFYAAASIILMIFVPIGIISSKEITLWFDAFAIASQSHIIKSSQRITNLGWPFTIFYSISQIIRAIYGIYLSFQILEISMWFDFIASITILLYTSDFFFFYTSAFFKFNEPNLPI